MKITSERTSGVIEMEDGAGDFHVKTILLRQLDDGQFLNCELFGILKRRGSSDDRIKIVVKRLVPEYEVRVPFDILYAGWDEWRIVADGGPKS